MSEHDITKLLGKAVDGETAAWNELFERYDDKLHRMVRQMRPPDGEHGVEDVVQSVVRMLFRQVKEGKYDQLDNRSDLIKFIRKIARARVALAWRKAYRGGGLKGEEAFGPAGIEQSITDEKLMEIAEVEIGEFSDMLNRYLPSDRMKKVFGLLLARVEEEKGPPWRTTNSDLAQRAGIPLGTFEKDKRHIRKVVMRLVPPEMKELIPKDTIEKFSGEE